MRQELQKKIDFAIWLLKTVGESYDGTIEVAYSGGKDSDVILQLAKEAGINYRCIYKNTTIDPPGTIKHAEEMGAEIVRPKKSFFQLMDENGMPSRYYRFCCSKLKEYHYDKSMHKVVIGIRKAESVKRDKNYDSPTECIGTKKDPNEAIYPILTWTDEDVADFIADRKIKCAPRYYDEEGNFHVERRLGCMCCPLQSKKLRRESFNEFPKMARAYIRHLDIYMRTHPDSEYISYYDDAYEWFYAEVFCATREEFRDTKTAILFEKPNYKEYLENYFKIKL